MRNCHLIILIISLLFFVNCKDNKIPSDYTPSDNEVSIKLLYTNDEHGWMEPNENNSGASGMVSLWKNNEDYSEEGCFLILSGGDMWTGPALSTWFEGESMTAVMNAMNYDAAAIGNHEFDFGQDGLASRADQANFPFLAANIRLEGSSNFPTFISPYTIKNIKGIKIGIIGLTTLSTETINFPENVIGLDFLPYENVLNEIVPLVKEEGADIMILVGHFCIYTMQSLSQLANNLGISLICGGHCHETVNTNANGVTLVVAGSYMQNYASVNIVYDTVEQSVSDISTHIVDNVSQSLDVGISTIISEWDVQLDDALSEVIGYTNTIISRSSDEMFNMITDSWLISWPNADISITNTGGFRQDIPHGNITIETMVGVLPFENFILELELTGSQIISILNNHYENLVVGGMTTIGGYSLTDGSLIHSDSIYQVLSTDYLYYTTDNFQSYDPTPVETSLNYRQPVIDWIRSLNTSQADPLDNYLDNTPRQ